jgi:hypothetical protein
MNLNWLTLDCNYVQGILIQKRNLLGGFWKHEKSPRRNFDNFANTLTSQQDSDVQLLSGKNTL